MPLPARAATPYRRRAQRPLAGDTDDPLHKCSRVLARLLVAVGGLMGALYLTSLENGNIDIAVERSVEKHDQHVRDELSEERRQHFLNELSDGGDGDGGGGLRGPAPGEGDDKFEFAERDDGKRGVADEFSKKSSSSGSAEGKLGYASSGDSDEDEDDEDEEDEDNEEDDDEEESASASKVEDDSSGDEEEEEEESASASGDEDDRSGGGDEDEGEEEEGEGTEESASGGSDDASASASEGSETDAAKDASSANNVAKPKFAPDKIRRIALLGERNSGTRWISAELAKCFPAITVTPRLLRWKHWFQSDDGKGHNPTLVVCQFRNPYDWVEAMRKVPHHSPEHLNLEWKEFVEKPWTMPRPKRDSELKEKKGNVCYEHFKYDELISCVEGNKTDPEYLAMFDSKTGKNVYESTIDDPHDYSAHKPIYELKNDGSGKPYDSILDLRADKIKNFLSIKEWKWIADSIPVRYETLLAEGTEDLIKQVEELTGLKRKCKPSPPQVRRKRVLDKEYVRWMTEHVDWDAEGLIGYEKRPDPDDEKEEGGEDEETEEEEETEASESDDEGVSLKGDEEKAKTEEK